ncbi:uncharacterized protein LOC143244755 isoform X2 [Tachypleus tridentatus]|uniref:uncharacterized protein LOC143244755 isoform X2 n=1 Tax=Tachypleus tridentatus TaxID=6853 RepID=UPI003FD22814
MGEKQRGTWRVEFSSKAPPSALSRKEKSTTMECILSYLQQLERKTQQTGSLPKTLHFTSKQACRFELPINMKILESKWMYKLHSVALRPLTYLVKYCKVDPIKRQSSRKVYNKHCKINIEDSLKPHHLKAALEDSFGCLLSSETMNKLQTLAGWTEKTVIDEITYIVIAALLERMLCDEIKEPNLMKINRRHEIEVADFSKLKIKLQDVKISENLKNLLQFIALQ